MHISHLLFLSNLFSSDMIIIVFVALLLFGGEKLPEIARGLGKGIRDFKDASEGVKREINLQINSFEEKREEEKRIEETTSANNAPAENLDPLVESRKPENTIPFTDGTFVEDKHAPDTENHTAAESEPHIATHTSGCSVNTEPVKNS
jgi:sec-independent protein translocase protein TatA